MNKPAKLIYLLIPIFILVSLISFISNSEENNPNVNQGMVANIELVTENHSNLELIDIKLTTDKNKKIYTMDSDQSFALAENRNLYNIGRIRKEILEKNSLLKKIKEQDRKSVV